MTTVDTQAAAPTSSSVEQALINTDLAPQLELDDSLDATTNAFGRAALLVIGMQRGNLEGCWQAEQVTANVADLVDRARLAQVPVIWINDLNPAALNVGNMGAGKLGSTDSAEQPGSLTCGSGEYVIPKRYRDGFEATTLADTLASLGVDAVVLCGAWSHESVRATLFGALARGLSVVLADDAHTAPARHDGLTQVSGEAIVAVVNMIAAAPGSPSMDVNTIASRDIDFTNFVSLNDTAVGEAALAAQEEAEDEALDGVDDGNPESDADE